MITFPDVSHHNGAVDLRGAVALIAKWSQGVHFTDDTYAGHRSFAQQAGIPFSAYHWVDASDAQTQATNAAGAEAPMMWDCEDLDANERPTLTVAHILDVHLRYMDIIAARQAMGGSGGHAWGVYLPRWYWERMGRPDLTPLVRAGLVLVSSDYDIAGHPSPNQWVSYGGVGPTQNQYTSNDPVYHGDSNRIPGTVDDLRALWEGTGMSDLQHNAIDARVAALLRGDPTVTIDTGHGLKTETNYVRKTLDDIVARLQRIEDAVSTGGHLDVHEYVVYGPPTQPPAPGPGVPA